MFRSFWLSPQGKRCEQYRSLSGLGFDDRDPSALQGVLAGEEILHCRFKRWGRGSSWEILGPTAAEASIPRSYGGETRLDSMLRRARTSQKSESLELSEKLRRGDQMISETTPPEQSMRVVGVHIRWQGFPNHGGAMSSLPGFCATPNRKPWEGVGAADCRPESVLSLRCQGFVLVGIEHQHKT